MSSTLIISRSKTPAKLVRLLENKAKQGPQPFAQTVQSIDWSLQPPELFLRAIDLALALEMAIVARQLAKDGFRRFPNHTRLQDAYTVLSPAKAHILRETGDSSITQSMRVVNTQAEKYRGQWVALKDGQVLSAAATLKALHSQLEPADDHSILITKVL